MFDDYYRIIHHFETLSALPLAAPRHPMVHRRRMEALLDILGNPHRNTPITIHVTGTSGKGSVVAFLDAITRQAGYRVGAFFSPHATTPLERIMVNGRYLATDEFASLANQVIDAADVLMGRGPHWRASMFEYYLAVAFLAFRAHRVNMRIIEVGCGGRYDQSNVLPMKNKIAVITSIGLDHQHILGPTMKAILSDKAGIIGQHTPTFSAISQHGLFRQLTMIAKRRRAPLTIIQPTWRNLRMRSDHQSFELLVGKSWHSVTLQALGVHQINNVALAISIADSLHIDPQRAIRSVQHTQLPCRFERIQHSPLVILDGAHNPQKMNSVASVLSQSARRRLCIIVGISHTKRWKSMIQSLRDLHPDHIIVTRLPAARSASVDPYSIKQYLLTLSFPLRRVTIHTNCMQALSSAMHESGTHDAILVTGSLYLTGYLRTWWIPQERILKERKSFLN